jgi:glycosyltransferase involved in cell wall biosynthesis
MDISVIIPLLNESESLTELHEWITRVMRANNFSYEIIFVDDGSNDGSWDVIEMISRDDPNVVGVKFRRNYGKSAALNKGFETASGNVVITMDADLQDSPDEIPDLYKMIRDEKFDVVSGWKKKRHDPITKRLPSRLYNWTTRRLSGIKLHDFNCGLKAYRNDVVKTLEVYGEMHRYIPVIAKWNGFRKIGEKVVQHRPRKYGMTKFGLDRFIKGYLDLLSITFVARFGKRPMHLFGAIGTIVFIIGFLAAAWVGAEKLYNLHHGIRTHLVTNSPYFYIALTMMIIGTQLFLTGFIAEMVSRSSSDRNIYIVEKMIHRNTSG